jgi:hypothetical protein
MKRIALLSALAMLAACSDAEAPAEDTAVTATEDVAAAPAASYSIEAGTYEYTRSDGASGINTLTPDGKFSNAIAGGEIETGTWAQEGDLSCLTPDEGDKRCYTFTQPDAEGNFTGTMPDGVTVAVRKVA